jgi:DNA-binding transcriptional regulator YhcF (GntR family)
LKPLVDYILGKEINLPENVEETVIDWERLELLKKNLNQFIEKFTKFSENELVEVINEFENFIKTNDFYKDKDKLEKLYILQLIDDVRRDSKNKDKLIEWLKAEIEKFDYSFMVSF